MMKQALLQAAIAALVCAQNPDLPPEWDASPSQGTRSRGVRWETFLESLGDLEKRDRAEFLRKIRSFAEEHPASGSGHRVIKEYCHLNIPADYEMLNSIKRAITSSDKRTESDVLPLRTLFEMKAQLEFDLGHHEQAMDDLELAIMNSLENPNWALWTTPFSEPAHRTQTTSPCEWTLSEFEEWERELPRDYRVPLAFGLYLWGFSWSNIKLEEKVIAAFNKAQALNPKSALARYLLGRYFEHLLLLGSGKLDPKILHKKVLASYDAALDLDPNFKAAYEQRAFFYFELKMYPEAITDFDVVLSMDPSDTRALLARAFAHEANGELWLSSAIRDYTTAIRLGILDDISAYLAHLNRGKAYLRMRQYPEAAADFTFLIRSRLRDLAPFMSPEQFRDLYPEFGDLNDSRVAALVRDRINRDYKLPSERTISMGDERPAPLWHMDHPYENRLNAYLLAGRFHLAHADYKRLARVNEKFGGADRWRPFANTIEGEQFIDLRAMEFGTTNKAWLKTVRSKGHTLSSFEIDCRSARVRLSAKIHYDDEGKSWSSSVDGDWGPVIPDSLGERLHSGMCRDSSDASSARAH